MARRGTHSGRPVQAPFTEWRRRQAPTPDEATFRLLVDAWVGGWEDAQRGQCDDAGCAVCGEAWSFTCAECGDKAVAYTDKQRQYLRSGGDLSCGACWESQKKAGRLAERAAIGAEIVANVNHAAIEAGTFAIGAALGGYVYTFRDVDGNALYIGSTGKPLYERLAQHARKSWYGNAGLVEWVWFDALDKAIEAERNLIALEQPTYNTHHKAGVS